jgi:hypothetical protein
MRAIRTIAAAAALFFGLPVHADTSAYRVAITKVWQETAECAAYIAIAAHIVKTNPGGQPSSKIAIETSMTLLERALGLVPRC